jgi:hypothetical protein
MAKLSAGLAKFEKSKKDTEPKGKGKEGSKQEEAWDKRQAKGMKTGGKVCGKAAGGIMRGAGKAVKGKSFSYDG